MRLLTGWHAQKSTWFRQSDRASDTAKERQCLDFISGRTRHSGGVPPSVQEIQTALALKSKSGVVRILRQLESRGKIRRLPGRARALEIVDDPKPVLDLGRHSVFVVTRVDGEATLVERE